MYLQLQQSSAQTNLTCGIIVNAARPPLNRLTLDGHTTLHGRGGRRWATLDLGIEEPPACRMWPRPRPLHLGNCIVKHVERRTAVRNRDTTPRRKNPVQSVWDFKCERCMIVVERLQRPRIA